MDAYDELDQATFELAVVAAARNGADLPAVRVASGYFAERGHTDVRLAGARIECAPVRSMSSERLGREPDGSPMRSVLSICIALRRPVRLPSHFPIRSPPST